MVFNVSITVIFERLATYVVLPTCAFFAWATWSFLSLCWDFVHLLPAIFTMGVRFVRKVWNHWIRPYYCPTDSFLTEHFGANWFNDLCVIMVCFFVASFVLKYLRPRLHRLMLYFVAHKASRPDSLLVPTRPRGDVLSLEAAHADPKTVYPASVPAGMVDIAIRMGGDDSSGTSRSELTVVGGATRVGNVYVTAYHVVQPAVESSGSFYVGCVGSDRFVQVQFNPSNPYNSNIYNYKRDIAVLDVGTSATVLGVKSARVSIFCPGSRVSVYTSDTSGFYFTPCIAHWVGGGNPDDPSNNPFYFRTKSNSICGDSGRGVRNARGDLVGVHTGSTDEWNYHTSIPWMVNELWKSLANKHAFTIKQDLKVYSPFKVESGSDSHSQTYIEEYAYWTRLNEESAKARMRGEHRNDYSSHYDDEKSQKRQFSGDLDWDDDWEWNSEDSEPTNFNSHNAHIKRKYLKRGYKEEDWPDWKRKNQHLFVYRESLINGVRVITPNLTDSEKKLYDSLRESLRSRGVRLEGKDPLKLLAWSCPRQSTAHTVSSTTESSSQQCTKTSILTMESSETMGSDGSMRTKNLSPEVIQPVLQCLRPTLEKATQVSSPPVLIQQESSLQSPSQSGQTENIQKPCLEQHGLCRSCQNSSQISSTPTIPTSTTSVGSKVKSAPPHALPVPLNQVDQPALKKLTKSQRKNARRKSKTPSAPSKQPSPAPSQQLTSSGTHPVVPQ